MGCYQAMSISEPGGLLDDIRKGRVDIVKRTCESWRTQDSAFYCGDLAAALEVVYSSNQLEIAEYFLRNFDCPVDCETVYRLIGEARKKCVKSCQRLDDLELRDPPHGTCCRHYDMPKLLTKYMPAQKKPVRYLVDRYGPLLAGTALSSRSLLLAGQSRILEEPLTSSRLPYNAVSKSSKVTLSTKDIEFTPLETRTMSQIFSWQESMTTLYSQSKSQLWRDMLVLPDFKSSLASIPSRSIKRNPTLNKVGLSSSFFPGRQRHSNKRQSDATATHNQRLHPFDARAHGSAEMSGTASSFEIALASDSQGTTASDRVATDDTLPSCSNEPNIIPAEVLKCGQRATSLPPTVSENYRDQHTSKESFDDISIILDKKNLYSPERKPLEDPSISDDELSPSLFNKQVQDHQLKSALNFNTDYSMRSIFRTEGRDFVNTKSIKREWTLHNHSGLLEDGNKDTYRSSTYNLSHMQLPVFSTTFNTLSWRQDTLQNRQLDTWIEDQEEDESRKPELKEWLISAAEAGNLSMVCVLSLLGATGLELALAHAMGNGFYQMADELISGVKRRDLLVGQCMAISRTLRPPISRLCTDEWRVIAEMCVDVGKPPPLSTRKKAFFFRSSG